MAATDRTGGVLLGALALACLASGCGEVPEDDGLVVMPASPTFRTLETSPVTVDDPLCSNLVAFSTYAVPQLTQCSACHNGTDIAATDLMSLRTLLDSSEAGQQAACSEVIVQIDETGSPGSLLFQAVDATKLPEHPWKLTDEGYAAFEAAILEWLATER